MKELGLQPDQNFAPEPSSDKDGTQKSFDPGHVPDNAPLLSTSEAAARAGVDSRTIRRWFASGKIKGKLDGHKLFVAQEDIDKMSGAQPGTSPDTIADRPGQSVDVSAVDAVEVEDVSGADRDALIERMVNQLVGAAGRISWLECELEQQKKELLLLPDLQARSVDLDNARQENEQLKQQVQALQQQLQVSKTSWWKKLFGRAD